jgi:hypothetical protein
MIMGRIRRGMIGEGKEERGEREGEGERGRRRERRWEIVPE